MELIERFFFISTEELRGALAEVDPGERMAFLLGYLKDGGHVPDDFSEATLRHYANVREINRRASRTYQPRPYAGRMVLLRSAETRDKRPRDPDLGWGELAAGGAQVVDVGGAHHRMVFEPYVETLAAELRRFLEVAVTA